MDAYNLQFISFGHKTYGILVPQPGMEPTPPTLEGKVLTTGLPGKSQDDAFCVVIIKNITLEIEVLNLLVENKR